jgi:antirestriction protein ArdC
MSQSQKEIQQSITNRLVDSLKSGSNIPWRRPWRTVGPKFPTNHVTGRAYHGINVLTLWLAAQEKNFPVDLWASYQQWASIGCQVKKDEKSERIVFYSPVKKLKKDANGIEKVETFPILKSWSVFNVAQVEGKAVEEFQSQPSGLKFSEPNRAEFDLAVVATGADIRFGGNQAFYRRLPDDFVQVPNEEFFLNFSSFAETLLHEVGGHWTEHRLGWTGSYAEGELRAEITACFLSAALGIPDSGDLANHAKYLEGWLQAIEDGDTKFIWRASSAASKAAEYFLAFSQEQAAVVEEDAEAVLA